MVDMSAAQLHTLSQAACIRVLTWEQFFDIWGRSNFEVFKSVYESNCARCSRKKPPSSGTTTTTFPHNFIWMSTSGLMAKSCACRCLPACVSA